MKRALFVCLLALAPVGCGSPERAPRTQGYVPAPLPAELGQPDDRVAFVRTALVEDASLGNPSPELDDPALVLNTSQGLCPLDVRGLTARIRTGDGQVWVLLEAPSESRRAELRERARIMDYRTRFLQPAAYMDRMRELPIAVDVTVQNVNGGVLLGLRPLEPWKLDELKEMLEREQRWLGRGDCAGP